MASTPSEIKVSIEQVIHKTLREAIQRISDQRHIQVDSLSINWIDFSTPEESKHIVTSIRATTSSSR